MCEDSLGNQRKENEVLLRKLISINLKNKTENISLYTDTTVDGFLRIEASFLFGKYGYLQENEEPTMFMTNEMATQFVYTFSRKVVS